MISPLLNAIVLSTATLFGQSPQQANNWSRPQAQDSNNYGFVVNRSPQLLNDNQINAAITELDSDNYRERDSATQRLREHRQALVVAGQFNELETFITRLQKIQNPSLEVSQRIEKLLNK